MRIFQESASRPKIVTTWPFHVGTLYSVIAHMSLPSVPAGTNLEIRTRKTVPARLNRSAAIMGKTTEPA
jgi:hypothetical protein